MMHRGTDLILELPLLVSIISKGQVQLSGRNKVNRLLTKFSLPLAYTSNMALTLNRRKIGRNIALFAALCGLLGAVGFFQPAHLVLYVLQTKASGKNVSGDIVVVGIDSESINSIGRWPWPRETQAKLLRSMDSYNPKSVYVDIGYQGTTSEASDSSLRTTIENMKAPTTVIALATADGNQRAKSIFSHPAAVGDTIPVTAFVPYMFGHIWQLPTTLETEKGELFSVAAKMAEKPVPKNQNFKVDYTLNPESIPIYRAKDAIARKIPRSKLAGKTLILGVTDKTQNDVHSMPAWGQRAGVLFHVLGAETLKRGYPIETGWLPFFLLALAACVALLTSKGLRYSKHITVATSTATLIASTWLTTLHIGNDPVPAIMLLTIVGIYAARQKAALLRSQRDPNTGLSDISGYMVDEVTTNTWFIAATPQITTSVRGYITNEDRQLIAKKIANRLSTIVDERQLTCNDEQQFLWEMPTLPTNNLADHLEGMRRLFAPPITIGERQIEVDMFFGVDRNLMASVKQRATAALKTSKEALRLNTTYKIAATQSFEDYLSRNFGSELEGAVADGSAQLMLLPEQHLNRKTVLSAEAALRWTHPGHGQIATRQLIELARQSGYLAAYSMTLCKMAMMQGAALGKIASRFNLTIKIAAEMLSDIEILASIVRSAQEAKCPAENITLEIVNIHANKSNRDLLQAIQSLQSHGFRTGIGDFGISNSDIELLTTIKPNAIYFAKSFCAELLGSKSNSLYAEAVMRIAKANGVQTIATDIDDHAILAELTRHGCDQGKGKIIGIPMNQNDFIEAYLTGDAKNFA
jgi:diguanylate cyclase